MGPVGELAFGKTRVTPTGPSATKQYEGELCPNLAAEPRLGSSCDTQHLYRSRCLAWNTAFWTFLLHCPSRVGIKVHIRLNLVMKSGEFFCTVLLM